MTRLAQATGAPFSRIAAIDGVRGRNLVSNEEVAGPINSSDAWIRQRTGIITRARADAAEDVIDLAADAARRVLARVEIEPDAIDAVVMATITHFSQTPSAAAILAHRIGATGAMAMDISAACAGFCYGIGIADGLGRSGAAGTVLVIGAEKLTDFIDPADRTISFLLGDGAGTAVVTRGERPGIGPTVWGADGSRAGDIGQTHSWKDLRADPGLGWPTLRQEGPSVFKWAVFSLAPLAREAIARAGVSAADLAAFIPHQANERIIDQLAKQLRLPDSVVIARDIRETGNTSAASVPLAARRLLDEGAVAPGGLALMIGFGAGLAYAAQVVELPQ
jgi:3-oxoacyl-[acyl-carrier-protein] synthase-3